jgi:Ring finger domain
LQRTLNLPFAVLLFATPGQRREYILAIQQTRTNLYLSRRDVEEPSSDAVEDLRSLQDRALALGGLFQPLVSLLLTRLSRTVLEFNKVLDERCRRASEEMEAVIARKHREEAAKGTCIICFDDSPNIATLCCGKAVHLNCVAEWLASNTTCPNCRATMPTLTPRLQRTPEEPNLWQSIRAENTFSAEDGTTESDEESTSSTTESISQETDLEDSTSTTQDVTETVHVPPPVAQIGAVAVTDMADTWTTTEVEETQSTTTTFSSSETAADESTTVDLAPPVQQPPRCHYCTNRAALDCSNNLCGRCCVLHGLVGCVRHNSR